MQSLIDILGAMMIGSILMLMGMTAMDYGVQTFVNHNADAIIQNATAQLSQVIQEDLRKMGYGIPEADADDILRVGQPDRLEFISQLNLNTNYFPAYSGSDNIPDTIRYSVNVEDQITFVDTSIILYGVRREVKVSGERNLISTLGTTVNRDLFRYLDQSGDETAMLSAVKMVEVSLVALNPNIYMSDEALSAATPEARMTELRKLFRESYWRQTRVISKNLRR